MRLAMSAVFVLLLMVPVRSAATTVEFAGLTWDVRSGSGLPGNGCWDDSQYSAWTDGQGQLHLKIRQVNGQWCQVQVTARGFARHGKHTFKVVSGLYNLDPDAVFAMYLYKDDDHELDIEITDAFDSTANNSWHVVQKIGPGSVSSSFRATWAGTSTHTIEWLPDLVSFYSYEGSCDQPPCAGPLNHSSVYAGCLNPREHLNLRTNISLWIGGDGAVGSPQEVVISQYEGPQAAMGVSTALLAVQDAGLRGGSFANRNYGGQVGGPAEQIYFGMGNTDDLFLDPGDAPIRGAIQFDLSSIPDEAIIQSATLELAYTNGYSNHSEEAPAIEIAPFVSSWGESSITWGNSPVADASRKVDEIFPACGFNPLKLDVTQLVDAWVHGVIPNHGMRLSMPSWEGLPGNAKAFRQCESDTAGTMCPKLTVTYLVEPATPPAAPSWLRTTAPSASRIDLQWDDNSSDESGFKIERKQGCCGSWIPVATVGADLEIWSDTGLQCGTTYAYRVWAYNGAGSSGKTNEASATTFACAPSSIPACPTWLRATTASSSQVNLQWEDNSTNEDGFQVERKQGCCGPWTLVTTTGPNVRTWNNAGLACGTTYAYRVWAFNAAGESCKTNEAGTTTSACP